MTSQIEVKIWRGNPSDGIDADYDTFQVPVAKAMSVANVLHYINEELGGEVAFYSSCHRGVCRGCALRVNGRPVLACAHLASGDMVVEPLNTRRVLRDLLVR